MKLHRGMVVSICVVVALTVIIACALIYQHKSNREVEEIRGQSDAADNVGEFAGDVNPRPSGVDAQKAEQDISLDVEVQQFTESGESVLTYISSPTLKTGLSDSLTVPSLSLT